MLTVCTCWLSSGRDYAILVPFNVELTDVTVKCSIELDSEGSVHRRWSRCCRCSMKCCNGQTQAECCNAEGHI